MIEGKKVLICGLTKDSTDAILQWVNKPELRDLTGTRFPVSEFEHEIWIKRKLESSSEKLFLIRDKENDSAIGIIGLSNIDYINRNAELFIRIGDKEYISQKNSVSGYGTDAVITLTDFCFTHLNLHKIYLYVFESNTRAIRCYEKSGFEIEGRLLQHHFSRGKYEDVIIMRKMKICEKQSRCSLR